MSNQDLRRQIGTVRHQSALLDPQLNEIAATAYDSITDYNKETNLHRKAIFELVKKEIDEKIKLRIETYTLMKRIFICQLFLSTVFLAFSIWANYCSQRVIVSDNLLIAVVVTLTGSFLTFMGVAHKYIFSSSQEFFDYAKSITLHQED